MEKCVLVALSGKCKTHQNILKFNIKFVFCIISSWLINIILVRSNLQNNLLRLIKYRTFNISVKIDYSNNKTWWDTSSYQEKHILCNQIPRIVVVSSIYLREIRFVQDNFRHKQMDDVYALTLYFPVTT